MYNTQNISQEDSIKSVFRRIAFTKTVQPIAEASENFEHFILINFVKGHYRLLNNLIQIASRYRIIYFSQTTIANYIGYSRKHLIRILKDLERWGFIKARYRQHQTKLYQVSSFFLCPHILSILAKHSPKNRRRKRAK